MKNKLILATSILIFSTFSALIYFKNSNQNGHCDLDSYEYISIANHFSETGKLVSPDHPTLMPSHTLGYHLFLGIFFSLFNQNVSYIFLLQLLLCFICCFILYATALTLFNNQIAGLVATLFSINIGFLVYAQMILAEILLILFLTSFIYFFCTFLVKQKKIHLLVSGILLGISVIIKPVALFYIIPLCCILLFLTSKLYQNIFLCLVLVSSFYFPVSLYMFYNKIVFDQFCVTNLVSENLYIYFLPRRILPQLDETTRIAYQQKIDAVTSTNNALKVKKEIFFSVAKKQPLKILYAWFNAMTRTFFGLYSTQLKSMFNPSIQGGSCSFFNMQGTIFKRIYRYITFGSTSLSLSLIALLESCYLVMQYLFILIALFSLLIEKRYNVLCFFCSYIAYFSFITGHDGCGRYRLMFEPILLLLSALGIKIVYDLFAKKEQKNHLSIIDFSIFRMFFPR